MNYEYSMFKACAHPGHVAKLKDSKGALALNKCESDLTGRNTAPLRLNSASVHCSRRKSAGEGDTANAERLASTNSNYRKFMSVRPMLDEQLDSGGKGNSRNLPVEDGCRLWSLTQGLVRSDRQQNQINTEYTEQQTVQQLEIPFKPANSATR